jgi:hypothetical protein
LSVFARRHHGIIIVLTPLLVNNCFIACIIYVIM